MRRRHSDRQTIFGATLLPCSVLPLLRASLHLKRLRERHTTDSIYHQYIMIILNNYETSRKVKKKLEGGGRENTLIILTAWHFCTSVI